MKPQKLAYEMLCILLFLSSFALHISIAFGNQTLVLEHTETWTEPDLPLGATPQASDIHAADLDGNALIEIAIMGETSHAASHPAQLRICRWYGGYFTFLAEEEWLIEGKTTYSRAVFSADVDGDGVVELLTCAYSASPDEKAELRIWNWDGATNTLSLEKSELWDGTVHDVVAADVDDDTVVEIITIGSEFRIWNWDGVVLTPELGFTWFEPPDIDLFSVDVGDVDDDAQMEIVTAGTYDGEVEIEVWYWDGAAITQEASDHWKTMDESDASGLSVGELDGDGLLEMCTAGRTYDLTLPDPFFGLVTVWSWTGTTINLDTHDEWQSLRGNVEFFDVYTEDMDGDGRHEVVAVGAVHEDPALNCFVVYKWDGVSFNIKHSEEWIGDAMAESFAYTVFVKDVDGDQGLEIITGGRGEDSNMVGYGEIDIWGFPSPRERIPVGGTLLSASKPELLIPYLILTLFTSLVAILTLTNTKKLSGKNE